MESSAPKALSPRLRGDDSARPLEPVHVTLNPEGHFANQPYSCRVGCGACCIAPSISSPIPGMPNGKPAGVRCIQLDDHNRCRIFGRPERPAVCGSLKPEPAMCGANATQAMRTLAAWEAASAPT